MTSEQSLAEYLQIYKTPTMQHFQRLFDQLQLSDQQRQILGNLDDPAEIFLKMEELGLIENVPF